VKKIITLLMLCLPLVINAKALTNQLKEHNAPYLAMHGNDPVAWQEWNAQTVKRAKQENKLLFVSSGYFSCHWCHVMQRESYRHPEIAKLLNKHFIPVKVDRELNPSLDSRMIDFVEKTRGYAGWPLNVFITPEGHPLVGIVYLPPADFQALLDSMINEWKNRSAELQQVAAQASLELVSPKFINKIKTDKTFTKNLQQNLLNQTFAQADEMQGGFGEQNKFPMVPQLDVLLDTYQQNKNPRLEKLLKLTLNSMASQGLRDQLGGGFYRYSVDPGWQIPHFEKMLYDNALMASLYLKAANVFNDKNYEQIGRETLDFLLKDMRDESGAFIASMSAIDSNNVEGGYYLWNQEQLKKILTSSELNVVKEMWQIQGAEDIEGGHHLITSSSNDDIAKQLNKSVKDINILFGSARNKMLLARKLRSLPIDRKKIAGWNGLVLSALVDGARLKTGNIQYEMAAHKLRKYILENFWDGKQLHRAVAKKAFGTAGLEDAAYLVKGLLDFAIYTGSDKYYQPVQSLIDSGWKMFFTDKGWQLSERPLLKYNETEWALAESPLPSPSASLIKSSQVLAHRFSNRGLFNKVKKAKLMAVGQVQEQPFWHATYIKLYP